MSAQGERPGSATVLAPAGGAAGVPGLQPGFVDVLASDALLEGAVLGVDVADRPLVLLRHEGQVFALDGLCPHRGGLFAQGDLDRGCLVCPLHAWRFDVRDGASVFPPGARIASYPVAEVHGRIGVALDASPQGEPAAPPFPVAGAAAPR